MRGMTVLETSTRRRSETPEDGERRERERRSSARSSSIALAALVTCFAWTGDAAAQQAAPFETDNQLLRQGLDLFEAVEYERAVEVLSAALLEQGNSTEELVMIYRTLGTLYVYLGRESEAQAALRRLLCEAPDFQFDAYASPQIREVFDAVRTSWIEAGRPCEARPGPAATPVTMDHESPGIASPDEAMEMVVTVADPELRVASVVLHFRASGESGFNDAAAAMVRPGSFTATIPGDAVRAPAAEYYLEALDDQGQALAALGTARAPLRVPVRQETERRSIVRTWWFWTIVGGAVVVTGLGLGLGLGLQDEPGDATLSIRLCDGADPETCFN